MYIHKKIGSYIIKNDLFLQDFLNTDDCYMIMIDFCVDD